MVAGLEHVAPMNFKYCAIFDADFEPPEVRVSVGLCVCSALAWIGCELSWLTVCVCVCLYSCPPCSNVCVEAWV